MHCLAIEQSASVSSVALLRDDALLAGQSWPNDRSTYQRLFQMIQELCAKTGIPVRSLDVFAVGLGPGSFTGIRTALSTANGMALPAGKTVYGVNSAEVLAWDVLRETAATAVTILGDARRDRLWHAVFSGADPWPSIRAEIALVPASQAASVLAAAPVAATPDWHRIGPLLEKAAPPTCRLLHEPRTPSAASLGRLAFRKLSAKAPSLPLAPLYLHPAVAR